MNPPRLAVDEACTWSSNGRWLKTCGVQCLTSRWRVEQASLLRLVSLFVERRDKDGRVWVNGWRWKMDWVLVDMAFCGMNIPPKKIPNYYALCNHQTSSNPETACGWVKTSYRQCLKKYFAGPVGVNRNKHLRRVDWKKVS